MPALITHRLFGERSMETLPEGLVSSDDERIAFLIGNQGPDPFFFRARSLGFSACMELGHSMHRCHITEAFGVLRAGVDRLPEHDAGVGRAFALGMLSHYALDRTAHPFVYAQQWGIQGADPSLADAGDEVHAVIEADLDVLMLQLMRDGATVADFPPADELETNDRVSKVAGALMASVARSAFGLDVGADEYGGAVADMRLAYRLIEPAGSLGSWALGTAEGLVHDYPLLGALSHRVTSEPPRAAGNLDHHVWSDPFTGRESHESFFEVFERARSGYAALAAAFVDGTDLGAMTGHVNYSGRVLDADEEWDQEDERADVTA